MFQALGKWILHTVATVTEQSISHLWRKLKQKCI